MPAIGNFFFFFFFFFFFLFFFFFFVVLAQLHISTSLVITNNYVTLDISHRKTWNIWMTEVVPSVVATSSMERSCAGQQRSERHDELFIPAIAHRHPRVIIARVFRVTLASGARSSENCQGRIDDVLVTDVEEERLVSELDPM